MVIFQSPKKIRIQILKILKDEEIHTKEEIKIKLTKHFKLTVAQQKRTDPKSGRNTWDQRVRWEISWLRKHDLLKNVRLGTFYITKAGLATLELCCIK